jgi:hypothetical protein
MTLISMVDSVSSGEKSERVGFVGFMVRIMVLYCCCSRRFLREFIRAWYSGFYDR